jgi:hypothetical protein
MEVYQLTILVKDEKGFTIDSAQPLFTHKSQALKVSDRFLEKYGSEFIQTRIDVRTVYENANDYHQV